MELDELKAIWLQHDKKLSENLKLNEELLRRTNLNSSKREFQKPLNWEIANIIAAVLIVVYLTVQSINLFNEFKFSIPGILSVLLVLVYLFFSILKVNRFLKIDYFQSSVVKLQKDIAELNQLILRIRKYELAFLPILIVFVLPIIFKAVNNLDIYKHVWLFIFEVVFIVGLGGGAGMWFNKNYVDKKMNNAKRFLEELNSFEKGKLKNHF